MLRCAWLLALVLVPVARAEEGAGQAGGRAAGQAAGQGGGHTAEQLLRDALAPHAWMASLPAWPCRFSGQVRQRRQLGDRTLQSDGRLFQDCERGLAWLVERPRRSAEVFADDGNFLGIDRRARPRVLDGLAERRIGDLLRDLFAGDTASLVRDFTHRTRADGSVRLQPRSATLARHLIAIDVAGDARGTEIAVWLRSPGADDDVPALRLSLDGWRSGDDTDAPFTCDDALGDAEPAPSACDALQRPARYLERARAARR